VGAFDEAEEFLDRYTRAHGKNDDYTLEWILLRAARGEVDEVTKFCTTRIERGDPASPVLLEALASGYLLTYRFQDADFCLHVWRERYPDHPQALFLQGSMESLRDRRQEALDLYQRVLELDPEHAEARRRMAVILLEMGRGSEALPHLEYLTQRWPDEPLTQVYLARCKDLLGFQAEAERILDGVLARRPHFAPALAERGKLWLRAEEPTKAEPLLQEAVEQNPGEFGTHYQLYQCLQRLGKMDKAREVDRQRNEFEEDAKRIREIINRLLPQNPHDANLHYEAGMLALRSGAYKDAVRWFRSALKEDPNHAGAHKMMAVYYQRRGELGLAQQHRELAEKAAAGSSPGEPQKK
jgi:tetratricopeptide (TPR) repeat protein